MIILHNKDGKEQTYHMGQYLIENWPKILERWNVRGQLNYELENAKDYFQKLKAIRNYYLNTENEILQQHQEHPCRFYSSYPTDWSRIFTPIEFSAWQSIRCKGRVVLYPQYPALNYHLDFGNPGFKIALELDGKMHNKERDFIRDAELNRAGWTVFRVTGKEMNTPFKDWYDIEDMYEDEQIEHIRHWILNTGDGVIEAIKQQYFRRDNPYTIEEDHRNPVVNAYHSACYETLELHKS